MSFKPMAGELYEDWSTKQTETNKVFKKERKKKKKPQVNRNEQK